MYIQVSLYLHKETIGSGAQWCTDVIPEIWRQKQEDCRLEALAWVMQQVTGQYGLYRESLSEKTTPTNQGNYGKETRKPKKTNSEEVGGTERWWTRLPLQKPHRAGARVNGQKGWLRDTVAHTTEPRHTARESECHNPFSLHPGAKCPH